MKKIIPFLLLLLLAFTSFGQQTNPKNPVTKADFLQKSKNQKTGAWFLLGGGTAVLAITAAANAGVDFVNKKTFPIVPVCIGGAMMVGSVPLFIASGRNKRKGMSVSFKNEIAPQIQKSSFVYRPVPSLSLKISL